MLSLSTGLILWRAVLLITEWLPAALAMHPSLQRLQHKQRLSFLNSSKSGLTGCYWNMYPFLGQSLWPGVLIGQAAEPEGLRGTWLLSLCGISGYPSLRTHQDPRSVKNESESRSVGSGSL